MVHWVSCGIVWYLVSGWQIGVTVSWLWGIMKESVCDNVWLCLITMCEEIIVHMLQYVVILFNYCTMTVQKWYRMDVWIVCGCRVRRAWRYACVCICACLYGYVYADVGGTEHLGKGAAFIVSPSRTCLPSLALPWVWWVWVFLPVLEETVQNLKSDEPYALEVVSTFVAKLVCIYYLAW